MAEQQDDAEMFENDEEENMDFDPFDEGAADAAAQEGASQGQNVHSPGASFEEDLAVPLNPDIRKYILSLMKKQRQQLQQQEHGSASRVKTDVPLFEGREGDEYVKWRPRFMAAMKVSNEKPERWGMRAYIALPSRSPALSYFESRFKTVVSDYSDSTRTMDSVTWEEFERIMDSNRFGKKLSETQKFQNFLYESKQKDSKSTADYITYIERQVAEMKEVPTDRCLIAVLLHGLRKDVAEKVRVSDDGKEWEDFPAFKTAVLNHGNALDAQRKSAAGAGAGPSGIPQHKKPQIPAKRPGNPQQQYSGSTAKRPAGERIDLMTALRNAGIPEAELERRKADRYTCLICGSRGHRSQQCTSDLARKLGLGPHKTGKGG